MVEQQLTSHQADTEDQLVSCIEGGEKRVILKGSAGVGKTFLVSHLVKRLARNYRINSHYNNGKVYATAPTNKALAVLQGKITEGASFKTVHAALNLVRDVNSRTGIVSYVPSKSTRRENDFPVCRAAIVDECSMLNKQLVEMLQDYPFPIIFVGDDKQINPVNELDTPIFNTSYPQFELTEIIRQGKGNPIIDLSQDIDMIYFKMPVLVDGKGYTYNNNKTYLISELAEVNGTDEMKYLAWTNNDVDMMNRLVRERRYGKPKKIEKSETVVFNAPLGTYYTNQEVKVHDISIVTDYISVPRSSTKFDAINKPINGTDKVRMKFYVINDSFRVIHEHSEEMFRILSHSIKENCKKFGWNWKGYYYFVEAFADLKYNHAISVHKSQGSTYKQTIINISDIDLNKNVEEKRRLLYTAITRASNLVILNNVK